MAAITGVHAAALTPRREGSEIDLGAGFELIDFLTAGGVSGITLMGGTGEFPHFTLEDRARFVKLSVKRCRVPVIAGVGHSTLDGAVALGQEAASAGAAAVLLTPPYFYRYSQDEIRKFYWCFAEQVQDIPILIYNLPQYGNEVEPSSAAELLSSGEFAGIKDSCGAWSNFMQLRAARDAAPFTLIVGHDHICTPGRMAGADALISGGACAVPELFVAMDRCVAAGRFDAAWRLDAHIQEYARRVGQFPFPVAVREAVAIRGVKTGPHAAPLGPAGQQRLDQFRSWFREWLPAILKEAKNA